MEEFTGKVAHKNFAGNAKFEIILVSYATTNTTL